MTDPDPCTWCGQPPERKRGEEGHYLECSNGIECPGWPYTESFPSEAESVSAWNAIVASKPARD